MSKTLPAQITTELYKQGNKPRWGIELDYWNKNYSCFESFVARIATYSSVSSGASDTGLQDVDETFVTDGVRVGDYIVVTSASLPAMEDEYEITSVTETILAIDGWGEWAGETVDDYYIERRYTGKLEGAFGFSANAKREDSYAKVSNIVISILNQELESDMFNGNLYPENSDVTVYLYMDDGTTILYSEALELYKGLISDFPTIDFDTISVEFMTKWIYESNIIPPNKIEQADFDDFNSDTSLYMRYPNLDIIGKVKPIVIGDHPFYYGTVGIASTYVDEYTQNKNHNMVPLLYLGKSSTPIQYAFFMADHYLYGLPSGTDEAHQIWYQDSYGRFYRVDRTDGDIIQNNDKTWVFIDTQHDVDTFFFPDANVSTSTAGTGSVSDENNAANGDGSTFATLEVTDSPITDQAILTISFDDDDNFSIPAANSKDVILIVEFTRDSAALSLTVSRSTSDYTVSPGSKSKVTAFTISNVSSVGETITITLESVGADSGDVGTAKVYAIYKKLNYEVGDGAYKYKNELPDYNKVFASCAGLKDDASGTYTGSASSLIQNPADVVHYFIDQYGGAAPADIDISSFTSGRSDLSSWKADFILNTQMTLRSFLQAMPKDFKSLVKYDGSEFNLKVYDSSADFSVSGTGTPDNKDIYEFDPTVTGEVTTHNPILKEPLLQMRRVPDDIYTKLILDYYKQIATGEYLKSDDDTDTTYHSETIVEEQSSDYIMNDTTAAALITHRLGLRSRKPFEIVFHTWLQGVRLEEWDVINIRHPILEGIFGSATMNSKKWLVVGSSLDVRSISYQITVVEL